MDDEHPRRLGDRPEVDVDLLAVGTADADDVAVVELHHRRALSAVAVHPVADGPGLVLDRDLKPDNVAMLELGLVASVCARGLKQLGERGRSAAGLRAAIR
jgi:hypothetical protein